MGTLYVLESVAIEAEGGNFALGGQGAGNSSRDSSHVAQWYTFGGSSGGGGGGGGGGAATEIGGGGGGGGGGGAGGGGTLIWRYGDDQTYGDGAGGAGGGNGKGADNNDGDIGSDGSGTRSSDEDTDDDRRYGGTGGSGGVGGAVGGNGKIYLSELADVPYGSPENEFVETHVFLRRDIRIDFDGGTSQGASFTNVSAYLYMTMPEVPIPDRAGYVFRGYYTGTDGTGEQIYTDTGDALSDIWTIDNQNSRLYACWEQLTPPTNALVVTRLDDEPFDPRSTDITFRAAVTWAMMFPNLAAPDGTKSKIVFADALLAGQTSVEVALTSGVIRVGASRFVDHPLILRGPGVTNCTIVVNGTKNGDRILDIGAGNQVELDGYALRGGTSATDGGAIWMRGGSLDVRNCIFENNRAKGLGGAINAGATDFVRLENCRFDGNSTSAKTGGGGAINAGQRLVAVNCSFWENEGAYGGAIRSGVASVVVNSSFFKNVAWQTGGGVWSGGSGDHVTIVNCTLEANIANCQENAANADYDGGGGLYAQGGGSTQVDLVNSFFVGNRPTSRSRPDVQFGANVATLKVYASMFGVAHPQIVENAKYNVLLGKEERTFFEIGAREINYRQLRKKGMTHDYLRTVDTAGDVGYAVYHDASWQNVALAKTWGGDKGPLYGSAESATALLLEDISSRDLAACCTRSQCGSYWYVHDHPESGTVVTKIEDESDDYDGSYTLREILRGICEDEASWSSNKVGGVYVITFDERLRGGTFRLSESGHLDVRGATTNGVSVVVDGGDLGITIDGNGVNRAFAVRRDSSLELRNLTFTNCVGAATSGDDVATGFDGGAVLNLGTLTVSNCTFAACAGGPSIDHPAGFGGAICNGSDTNLATMAAYASTFADCRAARGGAIYSYDGGVTTIDGCTFSGNRAGSDISTFVAAGGAIGAASGATLAYAGCAFDDNSVLIDGYDIPDDVQRASDRLHAIRYANGEVAVAIDALVLPNAASCAFDMSGATAMSDGSPAVTANPTGLRPGLWYGLGHTEDLAIPFKVDEATWVKSGADGSLASPLLAPLGNHGRGFYTIFVKE